MKKNILNYTKSELEQEPLLKHEKAFRVKQIYEWLHQKLVSEFSEMSNLSKGLREALAEEYVIGGLECALHRVSRIDGTEKFLFTLQDGHQIETVLMRYQHGNSICVSTQVGCRMGCNFCASTLDGLARNLTSGEILAQVYQVREFTEERISNIVLMGQGEPLDNYDEVMRFIRCIIDPDGLNISRRNITLSTCGIVPKIRQLADEDLGVTLAISLHAPNDDLRRTMMPIANRYTIEEILDAVRYFMETTGRRVTFEYSLVRGVNDSLSQAQELCDRIRGLLCHVNLIPINPVEERDYKQPDNGRIAAFKKILEKNSINVTIRREMGSDISGACGQLRRSFSERNA